MLEQLYDGYGFQENGNFVTTNDQKGLEYNPAFNVPVEYTEMCSFFSEAGYPPVDLVTTTLGVF